MNKRGHVFQGSLLLHEPFVLIIIQIILRNNTLWE